MRELLGKKCELRSLNGGVRLARERATDRSRHRGGEWWGKCVPNLAIGRCLSTGEPPSIRESLQTCHHADCQSRKCIYREIAWRRAVRDPSSIHTEHSPVLARSGRPEVRPSMLLGSANNRRRNAVCAPRP